MTNFSIDKVEKVQMIDINILSEPIINFANAMIEAEIETSSLADEVLSLNHTASFKGELTYCSSSFDYITGIGNTNSRPLYAEYDIPIMIQARWHKKPRINKKWLKRYGMKEDKILVRCDVDSISPDVSYDPNLIESNGYEMTFSNIQYKFRPDQLRKNLKIEL